MLLTRQSVRSVGSRADVKTTTTTTSPCAVVSCKVTEVVVVPQNMVLDAETLAQLLEVVGATVAVATAAHEDTSFLDRWQNDEVYRASQLEHGPSMARMALSRVARQRMLGSAITTTTPKSRTDEYKETCMGTSERKGLNCCQVHLNPDSMCSLAHFS